jgi:hypothetical protein
MFWNYRIIKRIHDDGTELFAIHEVYYNDDGKPELVTEDPCEPQGETLAELKEDFEWYQKALEHPVLNYDDFGGDNSTPIIDSSRQGLSLDQFFRDEDEVEYSLTDAQEVYHP